MGKPDFVRSNGHDFGLLFSLFLDDPVLCLAEGGIKKKGAFLPKSCASSESKAVKWVLLPPSPIVFSIWTPLIYQLINSIFLV